MNNALWIAVGFALFSGWSCSGDLRRSSPCFAWAEAVCKAADRCDLQLSGSVDVDECREFKSQECVDGYDSEALDSVEACVETLEDSECAVDTTSLLKGFECQSIVSTGFEVYLVDGTIAPNVPTSDSTSTEPSATTTATNSTSSPSSTSTASSTGTVPSSVPKAPLAKDTVELPIEEGWLNADTGSLVVYAPFFAYDDDFSSLQLVDAEACVTGTVAAVGDGSPTEIWGGGLGVDLGWSDAGALPFDLSGYAGLEYETSGLAEGVRFGVMLGNEAVYCESLQALGSHSVSFADLQRECWSNSGENLTQSDLAIVRGFRWEFIPDQDATQDVAVCVDALRLVPN